MSGWCGGFGECQGEHERADDKVDGGDDDDTEGGPEGRAVGAGDAQVVEDDALGLAGAPPLVEHAWRLCVGHRLFAERCLVKKAGQSVRQTE